MVTSDNISLFLLVSYNVLNYSFCQTHTDSLSVNWQFNDPESGIILYEVAYFEIRQGTKHKIYPDGKLIF